LASFFLIFICLLFILFLSFILYIRQLFLDRHSLVFLTCQQHLLSFQPTLIMKSVSTLLVALAGLAQLGASQSVVGKAEGFAKGVTGGGKATPDHPQTIQELTKLLTDKQPRVIVLSKEFDYTTSEGTESGNVCASWGTGDKFQKIIQTDCGGKPASRETWYKAARTPIDVASDKTILGVGDKAGIKGKGLRMRGGAKNIIIQNIHVTDLNPKYVWGGDAISFDGADQVWVDHVTVTHPPFLTPNTF
jgi:pectate lyase